MLISAVFPWLGCDALHLLLLASVTFQAGWLLGCCKPPRSSGVWCGVVPGAWAYTLAVWELCM